jgi:hypothetical protein
VAHSPAKLGLTLKKHIEGHTPSGR